jgi:lysophospholipase L1-like esterase
VEIYLDPRQPQFDPTCGIPVSATSQPSGARHRLVTLGDSLTQGFQSGAIYNTDISYPAIIAHELGWGNEFQYPVFPGFGGLPINIEWIIRELEVSFGDRIDWWETALALFKLRNLTAQHEDWWERGPGAPPVSGPTTPGRIPHNLAVWGWDLRDTLSRTADVCRQTLERPSDQAGFGLVQSPNERTAIRTLDNAREGVKAFSPVEAARALGEDGGIETLIVFIGANNALGTVTSLEMKWSADSDYKDLRRKLNYNIWRPTHFRAELTLLAKAVGEVNAEHVIWATVPHVTIAPIARGVGSKLHPASRYFPYYTRPWIEDGDFDANSDPHITDRQARAIDSAIDQYNDSICHVVSDARQRGKDWYVLDVAGMLDRLAARRYVDSPAARPAWWSPYELPSELAALRPRLDSRFFGSSREGRTQGGLFSLDGTHPSTVAYGLLAQEFINVMQRAGVRFFRPNGVTPRQEPVRVDWQRLISRDTLISDPPRSITADLRLIGWFDERIGWLRQLLAL